MTTTTRSSSTRAVDGDRRALEVLLDRHADRIHAVCRRIVAHPEDALDATQEAMIAIARGIPRFDGRAAFTTWCYRVATNAALDELRRKRRRPVPAHPDAPEPVATGSGPDDVVAARSTSTPRCSTSPRSSGSPSCCATCATSTTPRSPTCSTSRPARCARASPGAARSSWNASAPRHRDLQPGTRAHRRTSERRWLTTTLRDERLARGSKSSRSTTSRAVVSCRPPCARASPGRPTRRRPLVRRGRGGGSRRRPRS